jgi:hypothetical protein
MRSVRLTIVSMQKKEALDILSACGLSYSAFKAHAPYYIVIYDLFASNVFVHIILQTALFT